MEEPVPCEGCGEWVELQETGACRRCRVLRCRRCLKDGLCEDCQDDAAEGREE